MAAVPTLRACTQDTDPGVGLCEFTVWHHTHTAIKNEEKNKQTNRIAGGKKKKRKKKKWENKRKKKNAQQKLMWYTT